MSKSEELQAIAGHQEFLLPFILDHQKSVGIDCAGESSLTSNLPQGHLNVDDAIRAAAVWETKIVRSCLGRNDRPHFPLIRRASVASLAPRKLGKGE